MPNVVLLATLAGQVGAYESGIAMLSLGMLHSVELGQHY